MTLSNTRHEQYAQGIIKHKGNAKLAMSDAGFKYSASFASQLKRNPKIAGRVMELQKAVTSENIAQLTERLETLSEFARDVTLSKHLRMQALKELHNQSGDNVSRVDMDLTAEATSVIRFVEVALPAVMNSKDSKDSKDSKITGAELENLDKFLEDDFLEDDFLEGDIELVELVEGDGSDGSDGSSCLDDDVKDALKGDLGDLEDMSSSFSEDDEDDPFKD